MQVANPSRPFLEVCVKRAVAAVLMVVLVPALARGQETAQTTPPPTPPAETSSTETPAADPATPPAPEPGTATPQKKASNPLAKAVQARTPEEQARQSGFQMISALDHYLGTGTFVDATRFASLSAWLTIIPQYLFGIGSQRLVASGTIRGVWEYTMPDVSTGRRWTIWDVSLGVSAPALFREKWLTGIAFTPSIGVTIPTSPESWNAGLITTLRAGVVMSRSVKIVDFRAVVSVARSFHTQTVVGYRNPELTGAPTTDAQGNLLAVCRPGESLCGVAGNNTAWLLSLGGQVQLRATGSLLFYVGYTYLKSWRYAVTETDPSQDPYASQAMTTDGRYAVKAGAGEFDRTSAFFGGSYQLNEHYSIDLGVSTVQTPFEADNKTVRFPFIAFKNAADNATSVYFTFTAAY